MKSLDIMKAILAKGSIDVSEAELKDHQDMQVGIVETWDADGNKKYTIYLHDKRN